MNKQQTIYNLQVLRWGEVVTTWDVAWWCQVTLLEFAPPPDDQYCQHYIALCRGIWQPTDDQNNGNGEKLCWTNYRVCGCENVLTQRKVRNLQKLQNVWKYSVSLRKYWLLLERGRCRPYFATFCSHKHSFSHIFSSLLLALRMMKRISAAMAAVSAQPLSANYTTKYSQRGLGTSCQPYLKSRK